MFDRAERTIVDKLIRVQITFTLTCFEDILSTHRFHAHSDVLSRYHIAGMAGITAFFSRYFPD